MKFTTATVWVVLVASPAAAFDLATTQRRATALHANYSPFGKRMADGRSSTSYLEQGTSSSNTFAAPPAPKRGSTHQSSGGYSPFGKKMTNGRSGTSMTNHPVAAAPPAKSPASYSPFGKKMADGRSGSAYIDAMATTAAPVAAAPPTAKTSSPASYSPFGKKMADGRSGSSYMDAMQAAPVESSSYTPPAAAKTYSPLPASYSPFGKKMADGRSGSSYMDAMKTSAATAVAPVESSSYTPPTAATTATPTKTYSPLPASYSPFGKKMADGRSGSSYMDAMKTSAATAVAPVESASKTPAAVQTPPPASYSPFGKKMADGRSGSTYMDAMTKSSPPVSGYSPFGKKMADGRSGSTYLDAMAMSGAAPSYSAPQPSSPEPEVESATAQALSYSTMPSSGVPASGYAPFGKKMVDGRSGSTYLDTMKSSSPSTGSGYSPFGKTMKDAIGGAPAYSAPEAAVDESSTPEPVAAQVPAYSTMPSSAAPASGYSPFGKKMTDGRSGSTYLDAMKAEAVKPAGYSPFGKKMASGRSGSMYMDTIAGAAQTSSAPVAAAPEPAVAAAPEPVTAATPSYSSAPGSGATKPATYSPFGKKMSSGRSGSQYMDSIAPTGNQGGAQYSPFGKRMSDGRSGSAYLDSMKSGMPSPVQSSYSPPQAAREPTVAETPKATASQGGPTNFAPFGKKMADGRSGSLYMDNIASGVAEPPVTYAPPAASSTTAAAANEGGARFSPFGKKMADGRSGSAYLDAMKESSAQSYYSAPAQPAAPAYSSMPAAAAPKPAAYSPFGKQMSDGKSSSNYLQGVANAPASSYSAPSAPAAPLNGHGATAASPPTPAARSSFGKTMGDVKQGSAYLRQKVTFYQPQGFESPPVQEQVPTQDTPAPQGYSYLSSLAPANPAPYKYAPADGRMGDARSGNTYLDGLRAYMPVSNAYGDLQDSLASATQLNQFQHQ